MGFLSLSGDLGLQVIKFPEQNLEQDLEQLAREVKKELDQDTRSGLRLPSFLETLYFDLTRAFKIDEVYWWKVSNFPHLWRGLRKVWLAKKLGLPHLYGSLNLTKIFFDGTILDYGLASMRVVTSAGAQFIVDCFQGLASAEAENMRYHGIGRGTAAEAASDTALGNEWTSAYYSGSSRATGTLTEGNNTTTFRTVGTNTYVTGGTAVTAIAEHGIFHVPSVGSGVLLDRSVFSVLNLEGGDAGQSTWDLSIASGS